MPERLSPYGQEEAQFLIDHFSSQWEVPSEKPKNPVVLMFAGLQGSGKSAVINELKKDLPLISVSLDEVRQSLFNQGWQYGEEFNEVVKTVSAELVNRAFKTGCHVALDTNAKPQRREDMVLSLKDQHYFAYRLVVVSLQTSPETLRRRVGERQSLTGTYRGTLNELEFSLKESQEWAEQTYDLTLDTEQMIVEEEALAIKEVINRG
ncbi:MAG: ATP-binding protein [Candidatus Blackburnbacteria bacterium]|nr:ATP-binding protein [Candidatus Blackburnbacteria bacterium]